MPNDITTLAIEIQSQEAERNLRTFNELLSLGSQTAQKMEKISIDMDASSAVAQLQALRNGYANLAASLNDLHLDVAMPEMPAVSAPGGPAVDTSALEELKAFFASTAEMSKALREEMTQFNESLRELEANSSKTASAGGAQTSSMSQGITVSREYSAALNELTTAGGAHTNSMIHGITVSREYAAALKELAAAQKEMEKAAAKADEAGLKVNAADANAADVKRKLIATQRAYTKAFLEWRDAYYHHSGNADKLERESNRLKEKVAELKSAYKEAQAAAKEFNQKLEESAVRADAAREKYQQLKGQLDAMPKPVAQVTGGVDDFSKTARGAASQATKMARGFNAVAFAAGASIPGLNKIGQIIGTFAYAGPVVGGIVVGVGALAAGIKFLWDESQKGYTIAHEHAVEAQKDFQDAKSSIADLTKEWDRLAELESAGALTNEQNAEAVRIIEHLTDVYGDLGLGIDKNTLKLKGYSVARAKANALEREHKKYVADRAIEAAESDVQKQREKYLRSSTTAKDYFRPLEGHSPEEIWRDLDKRRIELKRVQEGRKKYNLSVGNGKQVEADYDQHGAWMSLIASGLIASSGSPNTLKAQEKLYNSGIATAAIDQELELLGDGEKGLIAAYKRLADAKRKAAEVAGAPQSKSNRTREALLKQGLMIGDDGTARMLTAAEQYARQKAEIQQKEKEIAEIAATYGRDNAQVLRLEAERLKLLASTLQYEGKISQERQRQEERQKRELEAWKAKLAAIRNTYALDDKGNAVRRKDSAEQAATRDQKIKELRAKIDTLLDSTPALRRNATGEDLLNWGRRFNPKTGKMDGDQKQAGWRGVLPDGKGGVMTEVSVGTQLNGKEVQIPLIVPDSTEEDLKRIAQIANGELTEIPDDLMEKAVAFAQKRIAEGKSPFFNGDARDEHLRRVTTGDAVLRDLVKYQSELSGLQGEQLRFRDSRDAAKRQWEKGRSGFVYDKKGNIVREKTDAELAGDRKKEIAAAEAKAAKYTRGSTEWYGAMAEVDRLRQEDFKKRQETSFANLGFSQMQAHNNMTQGVEARSSQALRLETRNFSKPDNAWKTLEKKQSQIHDTISGFGPDISAIAEANRSIRDKLVQV